MRDRVRERIIAAATAPRSLDGFAREAQAEEEIDRVVARALSSRDGQELLSYLRSITVDTVLPNSASADDLRSMEAQRRLVVMLEMRARRANGA